MRMVIRIPYVHALRRGSWEGNEQHKNYVLSHPLRCYMRLALCTWVNAPALRDKGRVWRTGIGAVTNKVTSADERRVRKSELKRYACTRQVQLNSPMWERSLRLCGENRMLLWATLAWNFSLTGLVGVSLYLSNYLCCIFSFLFLIC